LSRIELQNNKELKMKEAYYFSHDSNAHNDPKIVMMCSVYENEGYGMFWRAIESLREQSDYTLPLTGKYIWQFYARILNTTPERAKEFITDCIEEFKLFKTDGNVLWSERLKRSMHEKKKKSDQARTNAQKRWKQESTQQAESTGNAVINGQDTTNDDAEAECDRNAMAMQPQCNGNATAMQPHCDSNQVAMLKKKVNKSKEKQSKLNKTTTSKPALDFQPDTELQTSDPDVPDDCYVVADDTDFDVAYWLQDFGVSLKAIPQLLDLYPLTEIRFHIRQITWLLKSKKGTTIRAPVGYFLHLLQYGIKDKDYQTHVTTSVRASVSAQDIFHAERVRFAQDVCRAYENGSGQKHEVSDALLDAIDACCYMGCRLLYLIERYYSDAPGELVGLIDLLRHPTALDIQNQECANTMQDLAEKLADVCSLGDEHAQDAKNNKKT
jgi:hypothetical protein